MYLLLAPVVAAGQFASEPFSEWEKLEHGIGYLSGPARCVILCLMAMFLASAVASMERFASYLAVRKSTRRFVRETDRALRELADDAVKLIALGCRTRRRFP
jgi:hypothetical protein